MWGLPALALPPAHGEVAVVHGLKLEGSLDDCREGGRIWWGLAWFEPLAMIGLDHRLSEITGGVIHTTFQYDRYDITCLVRQASLQGRVGQNLKTQGCTKQ